MLNCTRTPLKTGISISCYYSDVCDISSFLKNITRKGILKYMGYKPRFYALLFRFRPTGIPENCTIAGDDTKLRFKEDVNLPNDDLSM